MTTFREEKLDLWSESICVDALVVTTNGFVKKNGEAVMGRGCAKECVQRGLITPAELGDRIKRFGNVVHVFPKYGSSFFSNRPHVDMVAFPVKINWWEPANLDLIDRSAERLKVLAQSMGWSKVIMPRPGCGNGGLAWKSVYPILWRHLDDRFLVVTHPDDEPEEEVDL